jgi:hypothetical protein
MSVRDIWRVDRDRHERGRGGQRQTEEGCQSETYEGWTETGMNVGEVDRDIQKRDDSQRHIESTETGMHVEEVD